MDRRHHRYTAADLAVDVITLVAAIFIIIAGLLIFGAI